ncbi:MAG: hypothetical protein NXI20_16765 [bacterium]|nr:hypothetical protein [bacterium]
MLLLKKWNPPGTIFKLFVFHEWMELNKIYYNGSSYWVNKLEFQGNLTVMEYRDLIELKKSLVLDNPKSDMIKEYLEIVDYQICRIMSSRCYKTHFKDSYRKPEDELKDLRIAIKQLKQDIILSYKANQYEILKFDYDFDHSQNLKYIFTLLGVRMNQLIIERDLPNPDYPSLDKYTPTEWIKKVKEVIKKSENPLDLLWSIRLDLDRYDTEEVLVYKYGKKGSIPHQRISTYPLEKYQSVFDVLVVEINAWDKDVNHEIEVKELKNGIRIKNKKSFINTIAWLQRHAIIDLDESDINWFAYSFNAIDTGFETEFKKGLCIVPTRKKATELFQIFGYLFSARILNSKCKSDVFDLIQRLIYFPMKGASRSSFYNSINEPQRGIFYDDKFYDFKRISAGVLD